MTISSAKFTFVSNSHQMCQHMQDMAGGLCTIVPTYRDWTNPEIRPYIEKYLSSKDGIPTEDRLTVMRLIKDMTGNFWQIDTIHGEGSMAAQEMFLYMSADWDTLKAAAKRSVDTDGWQANAICGKRLSPADVQMPDIDNVYESLPEATGKK